MSTPAEAASQKTRSRKWLWWSLALVGLLAAAGIGAGIWHSRQRSHRVEATPAPVGPELNLSGIDPEIAQSIERARHSLRLVPNSGEAWGKLGALLLTHKLLKEALPVLVRAESLQPQEPRWPYFQGIALLSSDPEAALPKLRRAAELAGTEPPAPKLRVANLLLERGELNDAERYLQEILAQRSREPHAILSMGKLKLAQGDLQGALEYLERAGAQPQTVRASTALLAAVHQRLGNSAAAAEASKRLSSLPADPPMPDPFLGETAELQTGMQSRLTHADRLLKAGQLNEALELFARIAETYPQESIAWQLLGQARLEAKSYREAETALREAVRLAPNSAESHFQLGSAFFLQGLPRRASESFQRSIELRPNYAPGHFNLGLCLANDGDHAAAIAAFREAIRLDANFAEAHRQLGASLALQGKFSEALAPLKRTLELNPSDAAAAKMLERATTRSQEEK